MGEGSIQGMTKKLHEEAGFMEDLYKVLSRLRKVSLEPPTEENQEPLTEDKSKQSEQCEDCVNCVYLLFTTLIVIDLLFSAT